MLIISMTESTPGPETRRPGFLSHSVHHSTLSRGNRSSLMGLLPSVWVTNKTSLWSRGWDGATFRESVKPIALSLLSGTAEIKKQRADLSLQARFCAASVSSTRTEIVWLFTSKMNSKRWRPKQTWRGATWRKAQTSRSTKPRSSAAMQRTSWTRKFR